MKLWKVILVTLVIFSTGAITGGVVARKALGGASEKAGHHSLTNRVAEGFRPPERLMRRDFVSGIRAQLELTPQQAEQMEAIVQDSQERTRKLWEEFSPQMRAELKRTQDRIRELLTPEQQKKFEELMKKRRPPRHEDRERREPGPGGPGNSPPPPEPRPPGE